VLNPLKIYPIELEGDLNGEHRLWII
jgi:hypothetical protein